MTVVHNCLVRALNSICLQAPHVPLNMHGNFFAYCLATYHGLIAHDRPKEYTFFGELTRQTGVTLFMCGLLDFDKPLAAWGTWLQSIANERYIFSANGCRSLMSRFMPALHDHLQDIPEALAYRGRNSEQREFNIANAGKSIRRTSLRA
jgi:hypothetical protein